MFSRVSVVVCCVCAGSTLVQAADLSVVGFDAPGIVVAEPVNPSVVETPTTGGELMRLRIPVTTFISQEFRGNVSEYVVEIDSPTQSMRVLDFWPKNEVFTNIEGTVAVESNSQKDSDLSFNVSGAYEPFGRGTASGNYHKKATQSERYQRKPPMQILTSSGTIRRGYGVFFKFRPGTTPVLEGAREVAILAEVPRGWRADMLQITMHAVGQTAQGNSTRSLGSARLWTTTHREGDMAAAAQARRYIAQERSLRAFAAASQKQVNERSLPTMWHKFGAAIDVIEPRIPGDYLSKVIFSAADRQFNNGTERLPVDLRVAVLDYWEQRETLLAMSTPNVSEHIVAKHASN